jgi:hypothetical protein
MTGLGWLQSCSQVNDPRRSSSSNIENRPHLKMSNVQGDSPPPYDPVDTTLPGYRRARTTESRPPTASPRHDSGRMEHAFYLSDSQKGSCAILRLISNARSPGQPPVYFEGQRITGSIDLRLKRPASIQAIRISVSSNPPYTHVHDDLYPRR